MVTATRGEQGTDDPGTWPPDRLAAVRERELAESLAVLGVHEHHWLDYHDGFLSSAPRGKAVDRLAGFIDAVRPDTIVTFGPDGMTGHDDHRTVSSWVTQARDEAGLPNRLWYATVTPAFHARWGRVNDRVGLWFEGCRPPVTDRDDLAAEIVCDARAATAQARRPARPRLPDRPARSGVGGGAVRAVVGHRVLRGRRTSCLTTAPEHPPSAGTTAPPQHALRTPTRWTNQQPPQQVREN